MSAEHAEGQSLSLGISIQEGPKIPSTVASTVVGVEGRAYWINTIRLPDPHRQVYETMAFPIPDGVYLAADQQGNLAFTDIIAHEPTSDLPLAYHNRTYMPKVSSAKRNHAKAIESAKLTLFNS